MDIDIMKMDREIREERRNKLKEDRHYCVYVHTCRDNGKMYVGMTGQKPESRWANGRGYNSCTAMERAIKMYGWNNFDHEVIASGLTKEEAEQYEIKMIQLLKTRDSNYGYNIGIGGGVGEPVYNPIYQFDMDGNLIGEYENGAIASESTGCSHSHILAVCCGIALSGNGYIWRHKRDVPDINEFKKTFDEIRQSVIDGQHHRQYRNRAVVQFDKKWNYIATYKDVYDALEQNRDYLTNKYLKVKVGEIISNCQGKRKSAFGYVWKFLDDVGDINEYIINHKDIKFPNVKNYSKDTFTRRKSVVKIDLDGTYVKIYNSIHDAAKDNNIHSASKIILVCKNIRKTCGGFKWKYLEDCDPELLKQIKDGD